MRKKIITIIYMMLVVFMTATGVVNHSLLVNSTMVSTQTELSI
jgi:hypothetical protein